MPSGIAVKKSRLSISRYPSARAAAKPMSSKSEDERRKRKKRSVLVSEELWFKHENFIICNSVRFTCVRRESKQGNLSTTRIPCSTAVIILFHSRYPYVFYLIDEIVLQHDVMHITLPSPSPPLSQQLKAKRQNTRPLPSNMLRRPSAPRPAAITETTPMPSVFLPPRLGRVPPEKMLSGRFVIKQLPPKVFAAVESTSAARTHLRGARLAAIALMRTKLTMASLAGCETGAASLDGSRRAWWGRWLRFRSSAP
ncbi:hypothetical protein BC567DRAFT_67499 [Phyllosticta citribraziliensis]